jgi:20S proteasome subunit beta 3
MVGGTASSQLYGMLEALYQPNLGPDELFETMSQAFLNAVDRDALSGWGVLTYIMYSL